jgi:hypothetical protein
MGSRSLLLACLIVSLALMLDPRLVAAQASDCSAHVNVTQPQRATYG